MTAAAYYAAVPQRFENMIQDTDYYETVRFLCLMSARIRSSKDGTVNVEPVFKPPTPGSVVQLKCFSKKNALFFLGTAANLGCTFVFTDIRGENLTREEANILSQYVKGYMQIGITDNGFIAASTNVWETSGCIAHEPVEFAAGLLTALPLNGIDSRFGLGQMEGSPYLETAYERLLRYDAAKERTDNIIYTKSVRQDFLTPKKRRAGRPRKVPAGAENA